MNIDLTNVVGFPVCFDPHTCTVTAGAGFALRQENRTAGQLSSVLHAANGVAPQTVLYQNYLLEEIPAAARQMLALHNLTYSFVMMPPLRIGGEYVKTKGHYHPPIPGTQLGFPEVYTQLYGELALLMQKAPVSDRRTVEDFVAVRMTPGVTVTIPPNYAHVLINLSDEPALMAGLYGEQSSFKPEYGPIEDRCGLAYFLLDGDGDVCVHSNPNYPAAPPFRWLTELSGSPFEPVHPNTAVWSAYLGDPHAYAFLTDPQAVVTRFSTQ